MQQASFKNKLIQKFSAKDFEKLAAHLEPVELKLRQMPVQANRKITHVYFPESGQASLVVKVPQSELIEVGMFGREGMSDMVPDHRTPFDTIIQMDGVAHRIDAELFTEAVFESRELTDLTTRYHRATLVQLAYSALSHGSFSVPRASGALAVDGS